MISILSTYYTLQPYIFMKGASDLEWSRASKKRLWSKHVGGCDYGRLWIQLLVMENTPFILQQVQVQQNTATSTQRLLQVVLFLKSRKCMFFSYLPENVKSLSKSGLSSEIPLTTYFITLYFSNGIYLSYFFAFFIWT